MNVYESAFEHKLKKRLYDLIQTQQETIEKGFPADFSAYRQAVGFLSALRTVDEMIAQVTDELNREEKL